MKNVLLITSIFICFCLKLSAQQSAYYDAMFIYKKCYSKEDGNFINKNGLYGTLRKYYEPDTLLSEEKLRQNPFFENFVPDAISLSGGLPFNKEALSSIGKIGGLDVTNIANGISQFMIKRAKEELTIAFFDRFKTFADENSEFKVLFPKTTTNLKNLLAYKYPEMLAALRIGFFEDIKNTPYHLDDVLELPRYQSLLKNLPEVKVAIRTVRLVYELEAGNSHAADILTKFAAFKEWKEPSSANGFKNFGNSVKLAGIFSNGLRNDTSQSQTSRAWITFHQVDTLVSDDIAFRIYLGLIYQNVKNDAIRFNINDDNNLKSVIRFDSLMGAQKDNLFLFRNKVIEFIELANKVDEVLDTIQTHKINSFISTEDAYYDYIDVSLDVIDYALSIGMLFDEKLDFGQYTLIARSANDLYRNIYKQEYTQAISNVVDILQHTKSLVDELNINATSENIEFINSLKLKTELHKKNTIADLKDKDMAIVDDFIKSRKTFSDTIVHLQKLKSLYYWDKLDGKLLKISQYGLFMANMANAESPEEISSILDNATLPVGSSSIKKNSRWNIAIQSYIGPFIQGGEIENNTAWSSRFGVTAPIGITFSKGLNKKCGSISLFLPLLDLGAIVDYQLKSETNTTPDGTDTTTVHKDYKVELGQIFSPGAYLVYGLPWRLPLSFGIGGQYGPGLGTIDDNNGPVINNPGWRWNAFLAVDIPLFNLVNKTKNSQGTSSQ